MPEIAAHAHLIPSSAIRRIFDLAQDQVGRGDDVIFLNVGEPDLPVAPPPGRAGRRPGRTTSRTTRRTVGSSRCVRPSPRS